MNPDGQLGDIIERGLEKYRDIKSGIAQDYIDGDSLPEDRPAPKTETQLQTILQNVAKAAQVNAIPSAPPAPSTPVRKSKNDLSDRELEVLKLVASDFSNKQIAEKLSLSIKTVEKHRQAAMRKLNVHTAAGLVCSAIKAGLVSL